MVSSCPSFPARIVCSACSTATLFLWPEEPNKAKSQVINGGLAHPETEVRIVSADLSADTQQPQKFLVVFFDTASLHHGIKDRISTVS
jgi:hypothetical protein